MFHTPSYSQGNGKLFHKNKSYDYDAPLSGLE